MFDDWPEVIVVLLCGAMLFVLGGFVGSQTADVGKETVCVEYSATTGKCVKDMTINELVKEVQND